MHIYIHTYIHTYILYSRFILQIFCDPPKKCLCEDFCPILCVPVIVLFGGCGTIFGAQKKIPTKRNGQLSDFSFKINPLYGTYVHTYTHTHTHTHTHTTLYLTIFSSWSNQKLEGRDEGPVKPECGRYAPLFFSFLTYLKTTNPTINAIRRESVPTTAPMMAPVKLPADWPLLPGVSFVGDRVGSEGSAELFPAMDDARLSEGLEVDVVGSPTTTIVELASVTGVDDLRLIVELEVDVVNAPTAELASVTRMDDARLLEGLGVDVVNGPTATMEVEGGDVSGIEEELDVGVGELLADVVVEVKVRPGEVDMVLEDGTTSIGIVVSTEVKGELLASMPSDKVELGLVVPNWEGCRLVDKRGVEEEGDREEERGVGVGAGVGGGRLDVVDAPWVKLADDAVTEEELGVAIGETPSTVLLADVVVEVKAALGELEMVLEDRVTANVVSRWIVVSTEVEGDVLASIPSDRVGLELGSNPAELTPPEELILDSAAEEVGAIWMEETGGVVTGLPVEGGAD